MVETPASNAASNEGSVFSGLRPLAPRCPWRSNLPSRFTIIPLSPVRGENNEPRWHPNGASEVEKRRGRSGSGSVHFPFPDAHLVPDTATLSSFFFFASQQIDHGLHGSLGCSDGGV